MSVLKQILVSVTQVFFCIVCSAQINKIDSLKIKIPTTKGIQHINCLNTLSEAYLDIQNDSALLYASEAFTKAENLLYLQGMGDAMFNRGKSRSQINLSETEQDLLRAISYYEKCNNTDTLARTYFSLAWTLLNKANFPASIKAFDKAYQLFLRANDLLYIGFTLTMTGLTYGSMGSYEKAFDYGYRALEWRKKNTEQDPGGVMWALGNLGRLFQEVEDYPTAIDYYQQTFDYAKRHNLPWGAFRDKIAECYWKMHQYDSALYYMQEHLSRGFQGTADSGQRIKDTTDVDFGKEHITTTTNVILIHLLKNEYDEALKNCFGALKKRESRNSWLDVMSLLPYITEAYIGKGDYKNASVYPRKLLSLARNTGARTYIRDGTKLMWQIYDYEKSTDSAYKYYQQYTAMKDSVSNFRFLSQMTSFKQAAATEKKESAYQQNLAKQAFTKKLLAAGIIVILFFAVIIVRNFMLKRKNAIRQQEILENELQIQKLEGEKSKAELQKQAAELEMQALRATTQEQLMQSEKMASLGELTSGIAHEIKNPLNFINNFSEINMDLISELEEEENKNSDEHYPAHIGQIIKTLKKNSEKINYHGKRVDGIVKGMLQHSRLGNTNKEPVDINSVCDESLKLAYHGYRAKEKTFNASFETRFDPDLPQIMVFPQDFGRVMINLINNAFYAVHEKKKRNQSDTSADTLQAESLYKPSVIVSTKINGSKIFITVSDNGMGIPSPIMNKIFQPFFTTKPTGEGTGLGLSMSYDIISKSHGGEIKAKSKEGLGTDFEIILPVS